MKIKSLFIKLLDKLARRGADVRGFLIPAYAGLGNFIMLTPMVRKLRELEPAARIYILAGNTFGTDRVFQRGDGIVEDVFFLPQKLPSWRKALFFLRLRKLHITTAFIPFDASPSFYWWGVLLAGIPQRIGHTLDALGKDMGWTREVLTDAVPLRLNTHETDLHFDLLDTVHGSFERDYTTHVFSTDESVLGKFGLRRQEYIVVQISAANATATPKLWSKERFAELIGRFNADGETIVLPGDPNEKALIDEFVRTYEARALNLAGKTSIDEVSTIIKHAKLLICHDSGLMHIGNAHETPLMALYGPTDYAFTHPKAPTSHVIRKSLPCIPCMKNFAKTEPQALRDCPINIQCMRDISVDEVYAACKLAMNDEKVREKLPL